MQNDPSAQRTGYCHAVTGPEENCCVCEKLAFHADAHVCVCGAEWRNRTKTPSVVMVAEAVLRDSLKGRR